MLTPAQLDGGASRFLSQRELALLTGYDKEGRLWTSPLLGAPGFLDAHGTTLKVHTAPASSDPLSDVPAGQAVGLLTIDFAIRRRMRVNGTLTTVGSRSLEIEADQAFGNCPSYIQQRQLELTSGPAATMPSEATRWHGTLNHDQIRMIEGADTFFLGTSHPTRGADTSHKGGLPGFVRIVGSELWWPDYAGNNMFNSMGNIEMNPDASLLFLDFSTGATLHLSGAATLEWTAPGTAGDDGGTGRRVRFRPDHAVTAKALPIRSLAVSPSPDNPALSSDQWFPTVDA